jgi:hypothetical protein
MGDKGEGDMLRYRVMMGFILSIPFAFLLLLLAMTRLSSIGDSVNDLESRLSDIESSLNY